MNEIGFTAPHHLATQAGLEILQQGGTALEAMVAAAATVAVVYPHMNSLGGDSFWLVDEPGLQPWGINAAGASAKAATRDFYLEQGMREIPSRGGVAALTVAGTVRGWARALEQSSQWQPNLPLDVLFKPAIRAAEEGMPVTGSLAAASRKTAAELAGMSAFAALYLDNGQPLTEGTLFRNPALGAWLRHLCQSGLDDFYQGESASAIVDALQKAGSPLKRSDLNEYRAGLMQPLSTQTRFGTFYNLPLPTQGIASLLILALFDARYCPDMDEATQVHLWVEATKLAFRIRNHEVQDPRLATEPVQRWLAPGQIQHLASQIKLTRAAPWPDPAVPGDTVWMGCRDAEGRVVSFIQSLYWEFGSGVVIPELGLVWNNRGVSFSLDAGVTNSLLPGRQPFHTLNPALARLNHGQVLAYGTMGGEGQPQTQAAIIWRALYQQKTLSESIAAPRWLLGRTWGDASHELKFEADWPLTLIRQLQQRGHTIKRIPACHEWMGHAGAVLADASGVLDIATDPRSDGKAQALSLATKLFRS